MLCFSDLNIIVRGNPTLLIFNFRETTMSPILRKWFVYRKRFEELEKLLDSCSKEGHTIFQINPSTALKGHYEVVVYKEPPSKAISVTP